MASLTIGQAIADVVDWHLAGRPEDGEPAHLRDMSPDDRARVLASLDDFMVSFGDNAGAVAAQLRDI